ILNDAFLRKRSAAASPLFPRRRCGAKGARRRNWLRKREISLRHWSKRSPVERARAVRAKRCQMFGRTISFVVAELIDRKFLMPAQHHTIAGYFGNDAGCRYTKGSHIAADDRGLREREYRNRKTIDQEMPRRSAHRRNSPFHPHIGPSQTAHSIDFIDRGDANPELDLLSACELEIEFFANLHRKEFRVGQSWKRKSRR